MTRHTTFLSTLTVAVLLSLGASCQGPVSTNPTADQTQEVRQQALRAAEGVSAVLTIANETGELLDDLPLDAALKNKYDCAILKATGTTVPASEAVVAICGPVLLTANAPLPRALETLKAVTTCPSLSATVTAARQWTDTLLAELDGATNVTLRMAAVGLRATLAFITVGGVTCQ